MQLADLAWAGAVSTLAATGMLFKVAVWEDGVHPNVSAANSQAQSRLTDGGFVFDPPRSRAGWRRTARRGRCHLMVGVIDDMGKSKVHWERAAPGGRLRYHFRGNVYSEFPQVRSLVDDHTQRLLSRMGHARNRAAVVATIERGQCDSLPNLSNFEIPML
jgi:hypothetical protein